MSQMMLLQTNELCTGDEGFLVVCIYFFQPKLLLFVCECAQIALPSRPKKNNNIPSPHIHMMLCIRNHSLQL
jgi:hypothetical protein